MFRPVHIALVEDHQATREALTRQLRGATDRVASVIAFPDGASMLAAPLGAVEVALVDLRLPGISGAETIARLSEVAPHLRAVALTVLDDVPSLTEAIGAGAVGYLLKSEPLERVVQAITEAAAQQHPVSSRVAGYLLTLLRPPASPLTERELELAGVLADGASYQDAADRLGIALGTVQQHVKKLYRKLDVNTKDEVRAWVRRNTPNR